MVSPLTWQRSLAVLGAVLGALALLVAALLLTARLVPGVQPLPLFAAFVPLHALVVLGVIAILLRHWGLRFADLGFHTPTRRLLHLLWQIPVMFLVVLLVQAIAAAIIGLPPQRDNTVRLLAEADSPGLVPLVAVGVVVLVPIWEETVFRGVIRGGLARRFPIWVAVVVSAALFAGAHAVPLLLPYLFAGGICLALLVQFHRTLWASVLAHAALNGLVVVVTLGALSAGG